MKPTINANAAFVLLAFCMMSATASADVVDGSEELYKYVSVVEIGVGITTLPFVIVNIDRAISGGRSSAIWQWGGWITGAIYIGGGIAWFVLDEHANCGNTCWVAGIAHLGYAAIDIGFTIWASYNPEEGERELNRAKKLTLGPLFIPDSEGNPAFGIGMRMLRW